VLPAPDPLPLGLPDPLPLGLPDPLPLGLPDPLPVPGKPLLGAPPFTEIAVVPFVEFDVWPELAETQLTQLINGSATSPAVTKSIWLSLSRSAAKDPPASAGKTTRPRSNLFTAPLLDFALLQGR
jgi:hypothetical protein